MARPSFGDNAEETFEPNKVPAFHSHPCTPCRCCSECACSHNQGSGGLCGGCNDYLTVAYSLDLYLAAEAEGGWFIQNLYGSRIVHEVGCPTFKADVRRATELVDAGCDHTDRGLSVPRPLRTDRLKRGARCRTCAPTVNFPEKSRKAPMPWEKSGTGWPETPHQSLTEKLGPRAPLPPVRGAAQ